MMNTRMQCDRVRTPIWRTGGVITMICWPNRARLETRHRYLPSWKVTGPYICPSDTSLTLPHSFIVNKNLLPSVLIKRTPNFIRISYTVTSLYVAVNSCPNCNGDILFGISGESVAKSQIRRGQRRHRGKKYFQQPFGEPEWCSSLGKETPCSSALSQTTAVYAVYTLTLPLNWVKPKTAQMFLYEAYWRVLNMHPIVFRLAQFRDEQEKASSYSRLCFSVYLSLAVEHSGSSPTPRNFVLYHAPL